jgi:hypothetical protein
MNERSTSAGVREGGDGFVVLCVRNTSIEDVHVGIEPHSPSGDYSDVKVVTPVGEIPWPRV